MGRKALALAALSVLALAPCLARSQAYDEVEEYGTDSGGVYVIGKHLVKNTTKLDGSVTVRTFTLTAKGVAGMTKGHMEVPFDLTAKLRIRTDGGTLLAADVFFTLNYWPQSASVKGSVAPLFRELVNHPAATPEEFGGEVVEILIGLLKGINAGMIPCNSLVADFFSRAGSEAAIGFAKTGGLK